MPAEKMPANAKEKSPYLSIARSNPLIEFAGVVHQLLPDRRFREASQQRDRQIDGHAGQGSKYGHAQSTKELGANHGIRIMHSPFIVVSLDRDLLEHDIDRVMRELGIA